MDDDALFEHIRLALTRGLPELDKMGEIRSGRIAICGSGPSIRTQVDVLRSMAAEGVPIMAVRDAHDWLISEGITPAYAVSVDPLETAAECFRKPHPDCEYLIASQSHPAMFEFLKDSKVRVWHCYMQAGQKEPKGKLLVGGATTSGLRAIVIAYIMGWRHFALFGFDSCLDGNLLRVNGTRPKPTEMIAPITLEEGGEEFWCNPPMALQAQTFQDNYDWMPDATFEAYGHGLIQAIVAKRNREAGEILNVERLAEADRDRVSFIHPACPSMLTPKQVAQLRQGDPGMQMASFRYRTAIPAKALGASVNDWSAGVLVCSKPMAQDLLALSKAKMSGRRVIVDFCDDHFEWTHYQEFLRFADAVICPTAEMAKRIENVRLYGRPVTAIIPDPYEFPRVGPHFSGSQLLWFGHETNRMSLYRVLPDLEDEEIRVVSNFPGAIKWSHAQMLMEFAHADIVIIPKTDDYKSPNRTVESLRQGCFVVAEPHPALMDIPGIWIGNIKEGVEWAKRQPRSEINRRISLGQSHVTEEYSPKIVTAMWKTVTRWPTTSGAETSSGPTGSMLTQPTLQT